MKCLPVGMHVKFMNADETDRYHIQGWRRSGHAELDMADRWKLGDTAAIIRMKIKRRQFHVRVGTNLTRRIQSRILLLPPLLSTPDEARGISSSPDMFCNQLTEHAVSILLYVDSTFQLFVR